MDKELENAITIAKTKFSIPESWKFTSNINTYGNKKVYYLSWRSTDALESSGISVSVDGNGMITDYNKYTQGDYKQVGKLPKISRQEAKTKAEEYIEQIAPGLSKQLGYQETTQDSIMSASYYMNYYRVVNGVPFYNDRVYVNVNRDTGELQSYSRQWSDNPEFPAAAKPITIDQAEAAYVKNLGLKLIYKISTADDVLKAYAAYVPIYGNSGYAVDAFTGERVRLGGDFNVNSAEDSGMYTKEKAMLRAAAGEGVILNPDELKAVQEAAKLKSKEEIEEIARRKDFLGITTEHKLQSYYLSSDWPDKNEYVYYMQFRIQNETASKNDKYVSVSINAKTGLIKNFSKGAPYAEGAKPKDDMATARAAADAFIAKYYPECYKTIEYDQMRSESYIDPSKKEESYNFVYTRLVNGTACPDNNIQVSYDNVNSMIVGMSLNWYDSISFPLVDKAIGVEEAGKKLFEKVGLGLEYRYEYAAKPVETYEGDNSANTKVRLVYTLKPNKPLILDANTGELLNSDGTEYKETVKVSYTDIKGHFAEEKINVLAENGIYLDGTEFRPNDAMAQKDFLTLLSKTLNYYGPIITLKSSSKEIDELYAYLQREGVIKEGEKAPDSPIAREDAVKFVIRALKYDRVADLKDIFNCTFRDKGSIDQNLAGYVTIAAGLGIIDGTSSQFRPKDKLTRSEGAIIIYNYLQS